MAPTAYRVLDQLSDYERGQSSGRLYPMRHAHRTVRAMEFHAPVLLSLLRHPPTVETSREKAIESCAIEGDRP